VATTTDDIDWTVVGSGKPTDEFLATLAALLIEQHDQKTVALATKPKNPPVEPALTVAV